MTAQNEEKRELFEQRMLNIAPMNLSRLSTGEYASMAIEARWSDWQAAIAHGEQERSNFYMDYRMKCDKETKDLELKLSESQKREAELQAACAEWHRMFDAQKKIELELQAEMDELKRKLKDRQDNLAARMLVRPIDVDQMVTNFLCWKLPENFCPDAGISFTPEYNIGTPYQRKHEPVGTNLFDADQARQMILAILPTSEVSTDRLREIIATERAAERNKVREEILGKPIDEYEAELIAFGRNKVLAEMSQIEPVAYVMSNEEFARTDGRHPVIFIGTLRKGAYMIYRPEPKQSPTQNKGSMDSSFIGGHTGRTK